MVPEIWSSLTATRESPLVSLVNGGGSAKQPTASVNQAKTATTLLIEIDIDTNLPHKPIITRNISASIFDAPTFDRSHGANDG